MKTSILNKTASLFNLVPNSSEFTYNEKIEKMKHLLTGNHVSYDRLLNELHVPLIHVGLIEETKVQWKVCPEACEQKNSCERMREVYKLVKIILEKLEKTNPIFEGIQKGLSIIGSVREGSKVFFPDEIDLHLSLNANLKHFTKFDSLNQSLLIQPVLSLGKHTNEYNIENTREYRTNNNEFECKKYAIDFLQSVYEIVADLELPADFKMKSLSTQFVPCCTCMKMRYGEPQAYRCCHVPDCQVHIQCT